MQQRQENKEKGKKQWTSNMARSESDGEENEGHQAMVRIGCRDRERREEEERVEGEKNAALAGRLEGARSDFGAEGCKARTIDWDENGQEQEWRKVPVCQGGVGVGSTSSYLLLHTLLRCSLCTFCVFSVYLYRTICFCRYCRYCRHCLSYYCELHVIPLLDTASLSLRVFLKFTAHTSNKISQFSVGRDDSGPFC